METVIRTDAQITTSYRGFPRQERCHLFIDMLALLHRERVDYLDYGPFHGCHGQAAYPYAKNRCTFDAVMS